MLGVTDQSYERIRNLPEYQSGDVLPTDTMIHRGTGRYHAAKRQEA